MTFNALDEFEKDLKKLLKKYRSMEVDLQDAKKIVCKSLKGKGTNSGIRLVYAHFEQQNRITFIE